MRCNQCRLAELCAPPFRTTRRRGYESLFLTQAGVCLLNKSSVCLSPSRQLPEEPVWDFRSFIKSFAIMVVQLTSAAGKARGQPSPLNWRRQNKNRVDSEFRILTSDF